MHGRLSRAYRLYAGSSPRLTNLFVMIGKENGKVLKHVCTTETVGRRCNFTPREGSWSRDVLGSWGARVFGSKAYKS